VVLPSRSLSFLIEQIKKFRLVTEDAVMDKNSPGAIQIAGHEWIVKTRARPADSGFCTIAARVVQSASLSFAEAVCSHSARSFRKRGEKANSATNKPLRTRRFQKGGYFRDSLHFQDSPYFYGLAGFLHGT